MLVRTKSILFAVALARLTFLDSSMQVVGQPNRSRRRGRLLGGAHRDHLAEHWGMHAGTGDGDAKLVVRRSAAPTTRFELAEIHVEPSGQARTSGAHVAQRWSRSLARVPGSCADSLWLIRSGAAWSAARPRFAATALADSPE